MEAATSAIKDGDESVRPGAPDQALLEPETSGDADESASQTVDGPTAYGQHEQAQRDVGSAGEVEITPQGCSCDGSSASCSCGGTGPTRYVYAVGILRPIYPNRSLEHEMLQSADRSQAPGPPNELDFQTMRMGENVHVSRDMCFVLSIGGIDTYIVKPRSYLELNDIISDLDEQETQDEPLYAVIVGPMGSVAPPEMCTGLQLPVVVCNQYMSFTQSAMVDALTNADASITSSVARDMLRRMVLEPSNNAGEMPEHRATNYLALQYPDIYAQASIYLDAGSEQNPWSRVMYFEDARARPAEVQGTRVVMDVVFNYAERHTRQRLESYCKVDVTGQFPFLVTPLVTYIPAD